MTTRKWLAALALALLLHRYAAAQNTLTLTGIVRDFKASDEVGGHPDFESAITFLKTGIVQSTLGVDGTPIYAHGSTSYGGVQDANSFDQWFHDVPGVNVSTQHSIILTETSPGSGIYEFSSSAFFPIDGMLFGNYPGFTHNYHFTFALAGTFNYIAGAGQVFSFRGDDDVWTFLDHELAIDLGGVHPPANASVNLDTFMNGKPSGVYPFHFFFAERHTVGSTFTMTTSVPITAVPEPSTWAIALIGLLGMVVFARRRAVRA